MTCSPSSCAISAMLSPYLCTVAASTTTANDALVSAAAATGTPITVMRENEPTTARSAFRSARSGASANGTSVPEVERRLSLAASTEPFW